MLFLRISWLGLSSNPALKCAIAFSIVSFVDTSSLVVPCMDSSYAPFPFSA